MNALRIVWPLWLAAVLYLTISGIVYPGVGIVCAIVAVVGTADSWARP